MNMSIKNYTLPSADGREAMSLTERAFWQSRMTVDGIVPPLPEIIHPVELLKESGNEPQ